MGVHVRLGSACLTRRVRTVVGLVSCAERERVGEEGSEITAQPVGGKDSDQLRVMSQTEKRSSRWNRYVETHSRSRPPLAPAPTTPVSLSPASGPIACRRRLLMAVAPYMRW